MTPTIPNTYDAVLYPGDPLAQAHPDRLATLATLFGLTPADPARCRVLELGCGDGTNLISVALGSAETKCVGIDLAAAGISKGQNIVRELGLKNIALRQLDLIEVGRDFGQFDFIIAHGVYSWVPPAVRDRLFVICKENLVENGVAYVSYNTYPGGYLRDMVRGMMRYHIGEFADPKQQVDQARALVKFLAESQRESGPYQMVLQKEWERIAEYPDSGLFHDDLSEHSTPVYFSQFAAHAAQHGLQYLAEANLPEMQASIFPPSVVEVLNQISDSRITREQYLDFLKGRRFRQTLLCHADREVNYNPGPEKLMLFSVASPLQPELPNLDFQSRDTVTFHGLKGSTLRTDKPFLKIAFTALGECWPRALHFSDLLATARTVCGQGILQTGGEMDEDARVLGETLLRAYAGGIVELYLHPPRLVSRPGERPIASPLARLQSREGYKVANLRHYLITIESPLGRHILQLLDGSRDRATLLNELDALVEAGGITVQEDGESVTDRQQVRQFLAAELERNLTDMARLALLVR